MISLPDSLVFEWDEGNVDKNEHKHGVTQKEAEETFINDPRFLFTDEKHSGQEKRYGMYGITSAGRRLSVVFTIRHQAVRIITARPMSKKERSAYEKIKKNTGL